MDQSILKQNDLILKTKSMARTSVDEVCAVRKSTAVCLGGGLKGISVPLQYAILLAHYLKIAQDGPHICGTQLED